MAALISRRRLLELGLVTREEAAGVGAVLGAAALTYIAALLTTLLTLLYYVTRINRRR